MNNTKVKVGMGGNTPEEESYTLEISEEFDGAEDAARACEEIAGKLRDGFTSGYYPTWSLSKE